MQSRLSGHCLVLLHDPFHRRNWWNETIKRQPYGRYAHCQSNVELRFRYRRYRPVNVLKTIHQNQRRKHVNPCESHRPAYSELDRKLYDSHLHRVMSGCLLSIRRCVFPYRPRVHQPTPYPLPDRYCAQIDLHARGVLWRRYPRCNRPGNHCSGTGFLPRKVRDNETRSK